MEEKKLAKIRKSNMKLYPIYKMFGLDWLFYYGITIILPLPFSIQLMLVIGVFIVRAYAKGIFQINKKRYMGNFTDKEILPKIYSVNGIIANIMRMILGFIGSVCLKITNTQNACIIVGVLFTIFVLGMYLYMKKRVGLKPEEYKKQEIDYHYAMQEN